MAVQTYWRQCILWMRCKREIEAINTKNRRIAWNLFLEFFRLGSFTYGGGWSLVAQMQQLYVERKKLISDEELLDLVSVGKSLPGMMITNVGMLFGYRICGITGSIACVAGMCIPPFLILALICGFYGAFRDSYWISAAMMGMQAAVVPIIAHAAKNLLNGSLRYPMCVVLVIFSTLAYSLAEVNPVWLILFGAVAGIGICSWYEGKEAENGNS